MTYAVCHIKQNFKKNPEAVNSWYQMSHMFCRYCWIKRKCSFFHCLYLIFPFCHPQTLSSIHNLILLSPNSLFWFQNSLTNDVVYNGLAPADRLTLGVVKVWGAGNIKIQHVNLTDTAGMLHSLVPQHNTATQVRRILGWGQCEGCWEWAGTGTEYGPCAAL